MATVNFSVPEHIKQTFNRTFQGENKSAVIARLMQQAIDERIRQHRRSAAINAILALHEQQPPTSDEEIARVRESLRP